MESRKPDTSGVVHLTVRETQAVEILMGDKRSSGNVVAGFLLRGKSYKLLPVGSTLDVHGNKFSWQPGAGFYGLYKFVFVVRDGTGGLEKRLVNIRINAKH